MTSWLVKTENVQKSSLTPLFALMETRSVIKNAILFIVLSCWLSISYADRIAIIGGGASGVVSA